MEENLSLFFFSSNNPLSVSFRLLTKQEFDNIGLLIPGDSKIESQVISINLTTGESTTQALRELLLNNTIKSAGRRSLIKNTNPIVNRTREENLKIRAHRFIHDNFGFSEDIKNWEDLSFICNNKTILSEKLYYLIEELGFKVSTEKRSVEVFEELTELSKISQSGKDLPKIFFRFFMINSFFKCWFIPNNVGSFLWTLFSGKNEMFETLQMINIKNPFNPHDYKDYQYDKAINYMQNVVQQIAKNDSFSSYISNLLPFEAKIDISPISKTKLWLLDIIEKLSNPEIPKLDLSPMLELFKINMINNFSRICIVSTKPNVRTTGPIAIGIDGDGLDLLTTEEAENLKSSLDQEDIPENSKLSSLIIKKISGK